LRKFRSGTQPEMCDGETAAHTDLA
jgi:hypothetical protein